MSSSGLKITKTQKCVKQNFQNTKISTFKVTGNKWSKNNNKKKILRKKGKKKKQDSLRN